MRLLVVEDSQRLRDSIREGLRAEGYAVDAVADGRQGLIHATTTDYDLLVLDIMIPEVDGLELVRRIRRAGKSTPVLILSARDRVEHRVEGLRAGADDYLVKPFAFAELLARIEALSRRARGTSSNVVRLGVLALDLGAKCVLVRDQEVAFTPREYAILEYLVLAAGRTVSRLELEEHVYPSDRQVWSNAVDSAIAAIRRKLAQAGLDGFIVTRRGMGYLVAGAEAPGASASGPALLPGGTGHAESAGLPPQPGARAQS